MEFEKLVGIYNAKGSLIGELQYFWGKIRGTAHCALCDITHGKLKEKASFKECKQGLEVPFELLHLDELNPELENCKSDVGAFSDLLNSKISLP